jgi:phage terminase small subunit
MGNVSKFTAQQAAFVESYMVHFNAKRAAEEAGFKANPAMYGYQLLKKPHIKKEIEARAKAFADTKMALKERIVEEICSVAFSNLEDLGRFGPSGFEIKDFSTVSESAKRAISEFTVNETDKSVNAKVKLHDKTRALDLLSKILQMHKDNEVSVNVKPYVIKKRNGVEIELGVKSDEVR